MTKDIIYSGQSAYPSDFACNDGDMAASFNLISEGGELKPIFPPKHIFSPNDGDRILAIHKTASYSHYIAISSDNKLVYYNDSGSSRTQFATLSDSPIKAECIGNAVFVLTNTGTHRYLWTVNDNGTSQYKDLSTSLPSCNLSFGLRCNVLHSGSDEFVFDLDNNNGANISGKLNFDDESISKFSNHVFGQVNKLLSEKVNDLGYFSFPFFVRYAFRLYDGSLTCHSSPILMLPSNVGAPIVLARFERNDNENTLTVHTDVAATACRLNFSYVRDEGPNNLIHYSDIIKSVDIFVSAPLYSFNSSGKCEYYHATTAENSFGIYTTSSESQYKHRRNYSTIVSALGGSYSMPFTNIIDLPSKPSETIEEDIRNCSAFYLIKSIPIEDLSPTRTDIVPPEDYLDSLVTKEAMTNDYDSHDTIIADNAFAYNSRMLLTGLRKQLFGGYFSQYYATHTPAGGTSTYDITQVIVTVKRDGRLFRMSYNPNDDINNSTRHLSVSAPNDTDNCMRIPYFFHPDPNAISVDIYSQNGSDKYKLTLPLTTHPTLNGAYYFDNFANQQPTLVSATEQIVVTTSNIIPIKNKLYVSEVDNPFFYPVQSICTVGTGNIIGVSSAAKALSQGQFGSFPLYAFCSDGVWALTTSDTGTFLAVQPIARDVCTNAESITQIDGAVLFATDRGVMMAEGSSVKCISSAVFSETSVNLSGLNNFSEVMSRAGIDNITDIHPSCDFFRSCHMLFDYIHQRVFIYNNESDILGNRVYPYSYVLSLSYGTWAMSTYLIDSAINSYPEPLAQHSNGNIVSFADTDAENCYGAYISRPIKFGNSGILKSIHEVIQRGNFMPSAIVDGERVPGDVCTILYGSRDLFSWFLVGSCRYHYVRLIRGTAYKYFRIAGMCELSQGKTITGATVELTPRELDNNH